MNKISNNNIIIGFNLLAHDSSISYVDISRDNIFSIDEERITRFKHDGSSISNSFNELTKYLELKDSKYNFDIAFCYQNEEIFTNLNFIWRKNILVNKLRNLYKLSEIKQQTNVLKNSYIKIILSSFKFFPKNIKFILFFFIYYFVYKNKKIEFSKSIIQYLKSDLKKYNNIGNFKVSFYDHHQCHCYSSFYFSSFNESVSLSLDYHGDGYFSKVFYFNRELSKELIKSRAFKDKSNRIISIGSIYTLVTSYLGFIPNSDEGKVEALAAYGKKNNKMYELLMDSTSINDNNEIIIDNLIIDKLTSKLDHYKTQIGDENIAAAVQGYLEDFVVKYIKILISKYGFKNLCLSGGTFANVKLNMKIFYECNLENIYIIPPMSDNGAALGALIIKLKEIQKIKYNFFKNNSFTMPYYGSEYSVQEIIEDINLYKNLITYEVINKEIWKNQIAEFICDGKIVGLFQGRIEFGPRALGNRSILGDAYKAKTKDIINNVIKGRPHFQPFCPSILEEDRKTLFERSYLNKHMTCAFKMKDIYAKQLPSAVHIDNTARPQFVEEKDNKNFYDILINIKKINGFGVVVNTSYNKHGRTMVLRPRDAIKDFLDSGMHSIFFENIVVKKIN